MQCCRMPPWIQYEYVLTVGRLTYGVNRRNTGTPFRGRNTESTVFYCVILYIWIIPFVFFSSSFFSITNTYYRGTIKSLSGPASYSRVPPHHLTTSPPPPHHSRPSNLFFTYYSVYFILNPKTSPGPPLPIHRYNGSDQPR